jgi:hypothetical protein
MTSYLLNESGYTGPTGRIGTLGHYPSAADAFEALQACGCIIHGEWDPNYPGCYDAFMADGRILSIEAVEVQP